MDSDNLEQNNQKNEKIFSISEYINILNENLKTFDAKIIGEVGEINIASSGHVYFSLKDEKGESVIKCVIWKHKYGIYGIELKDGLKIIASGYPEIYAQFGKLSFIAETIEITGEGELKKEYERLKKKLAEEGIFEEVRKRTIPKYPQCIGVITSLKGAVIADFSNNLGKFGFKVKIIDSLVEGQAAVTDLLSAIKTFKKQEIEILVIIRGGGSLESMIAFNNEALVREMVNFPIPIITGIGHHKDMPLVALAADVSVSTPTAVANLLNESWKQVIFFLEKYEEKIIGSYKDILENTNSLINQSINVVCEAGNLIIGRYKTIENELKISFQNFKNTLLNVKINLKNLLNKSLSGFKSSLSKVNQELGYAEKVVNSNNPERQLRLGYSIATHGNTIVRRTEDVEIGQDMNLQVIDGKIISKVKNINKNRHG